MAGKIVSKILSTIGFLVLLGGAAVAIYFLWPRHGGGTGVPAAVMPGMEMPGMEMAPQSQAPPPAGEKARGKTLYYCSMHPNYISDKPGECPICGMTLRPIKGEEAAPPGAPAPEGLATVTIAPGQQQLIGVQFGQVEKRQVAKTIRAVGLVQYNERTLSAVNLKVGGWVEELLVKAEGDAVHKGSPLLVIYSPELLEAQRNYLLAREAAAALGEGAPAEAKALAEESLKSARDRLLLWDMTEDQLKELDAKKEPQREVTIFSKVEGIVTGRKVVLGTYVAPGENLYTIADLSTVWLEAQVYEYEIPLVKVGQEAKVQLSSVPGDALTGEVTYIYPYLNEQMRTARVRMQFANPEGRLKPGMYATVWLSIPLGEQLVVDDSAIFDTGMRQIAFVDLGEGRFQPREVTVSQHADGMAVIGKGLAEGERVVTSANFLIDSESQLKAALQMRVQGGGGAAAGAGEAGGAAGTGGGHEHHH
jgi:RND family efflux transporter MFP subunit